RRGRAILHIGRNAGHGRIGTQRIGHPGSPPRIRRLPSDPARVLPRCRGGRQLAQGQLPGGQAAGHRRPGRLRLVVLVGGHQIAHLSNPWSTRLMAAPVGMQLGFDTLMPLLGAVMAPVTGLFGPSASYNLLAIVIPGLLCYAAYRAARLWLPSQLGAVAAGAFYGLATMLVWE